MLSLTSVARTDLNTATGAPLIAPYDSATIFHANTSVFPQWTDVMRRAAEQLRRPQVCAGNGACRPAEWRALIDEISGRPLMAKLQIVNTALNALPYVMAR
ncbi:MAG: hypothetical protein ACREEN_01060 [Stellaceae bacterium]